MIKINLTAFVDIKYGNDKEAKIDSMEYKFKTINAAIKSFKKINEDLIAAQIRVSPGIFNEHVILYPNMSLIGSGKLSTIISSLELSGSSYVKDLKIQGFKTPLLKGRFINSPIISFIQDVWLEISLKKTIDTVRTVIDFKSLLQNNPHTVEMNNINITADFSNI